LNIKGFLKVGHVREVAVNFFTGKPNSLGFSTNLWANWWAQQRSWLRLLKIQSSELVTLLIRGSGGSWLKVAWPVLCGWATRAAPGQARGRGSRRGSRSCLQCCRRSMPALRGLRGACRVGVFLPKI